MLLHSLGLRLVYDISDRSLIRVRRTALIIPGYASVVCGMGKLVCPCACSGSYWRADPVQATTLEAPLDQHGWSK